MHIFICIKNYDIPTGWIMGIGSTVFPFRNHQEPECSWNTIIRISWINVLFCGTTDESDLKLLFINVMGGYLLSVSNLVLLRNVILCWWISSDSLVRSSRINFPSHKNSKSPYQYSKAVSNGIIRLSVFKSICYDLLFSHEFIFFFFYFYFSRRKIQRKEITSR